MIKFYFIVLFFLAKLSYALDGTIIVLEAPLFAIPDDTSKVIQYHRKGELIYIHPQEGNLNLYQHEAQDLTTGIGPDLPNDPLFTDEKSYRPLESNLFYKTISKTGRAAFILKEHVKLNYKDRREFTKKEIKHDETDYRISEPLIPGYPFEQESGYRGLLQLAIGRPNFQNYQYKEKVKDTEINFSKELNYIWSKNDIVVNPDKRFFFGFMLGLYSASIDYLLDTQLASQENFRISLGPLTSYDLLRNDKSALNMYISLQTHILDEMKIKMEIPNSNDKEERSYKALFPFSALLGVNYQIFKSVYIFDAVIGSNVRFHLPKTYTAISKASTSSFWNSTSANDQLEQPFMVEVNLFIGLQSYY